MAVGDGADREGALSELCGIYWYPAYSFIRRSGKSPEDSEDLTQSFFEKILSRNSISRADPERGRFRTYVLTMLKGHMTDSHRKTSAAKRGGNVKFVSFDLDQAERKYRSEPNNDLTPDIIFERRWASTLLESVMRELRDEYRENGKEKLFTTLETFISWNSADYPQQHAADELGIGVAAVRMEVYYLRRRYRELLNSKVAKTVAHPSEVESELQNLREIFA